MNDRLDSSVFTTCFTGWEVDDLHTACLLFADGNRFYRVSLADSVDYILAFLIGDLAKNGVTASELSWIKLRRLCFMIFLL